MPNASVDICPICRHPVGEDRICTNPGCAERLDKGDWTLHAVYGTEGLLPPQAPNGPWRLPEPSAAEPLVGRIDSQLPLSLRQEDGVHDIGASFSCHVRIAGIRAERAVSLHFHRPTGRWWAFDWGAMPGLVTLNGERFRNRPLADDDILAVSGVRLRYRAGQIAAEYGTTDGVDLVVSDLTDARKTNSASPRPLLDRISFAIPDGEFVAVIGPSGCGKSTLVKALAGLGMLAQGDITFNGVSRRDDSAGIRASTAYLPQNVDATLHDGLTLAQEIAAYSAIHNAVRDENREQDLLRDLRLSPQSRIGEMSGGQRRRAAFLLALLREPSVLLLDEPAAGLDRASETALMQDLRRMSRSGTRRTILCATHELANIDLFDRVLVMSGGCLVFNGPPGNVFDALGVPGNGDERFRLLYERLSAPNPEIDIEAATERCRAPVPLPVQTPLPEHSPRATWRGCFAGYLTRFWQETFSFVRKPIAPPGRAIFQARAAWLGRIVRKWLFCPPLVTFLWQPLLVAACIACALRKDFTDDPKEQKIVFFCAALAAFWIGMGGSVRSLVPARAGRCLERLEGVSRTAHLAAVSAATAAKGTLQGIVLTAFLYLFPAVFLGAEAVLWAPRLPSILGIGACMVAVEWAGGFVGMALSALCSTESLAVAMVPNIAVLALFFSQPLMEFGDGDKGAGVRIARNLPAHDAHIAMYDWNNVGQSNEDAKRWGDFGSMGATTAAWLAAAFLLTLAAQTIHEKNWKG